MWRECPCSRSTVQTYPATWVLAAARPWVWAQHCHLAHPGCGVNLWVLPQPGAAAGGQDAEPGCSQASLLLPSLCFTPDAEWIMIFCQIWRCLALFAPRPDSAGSGDTGKTCWNAVISRSTLSLSFQAANQKKMNILVSDTLEISLNMKYFGGLSRSLQLLQLASLPVTGCRLSRYACVGFLKRPVRNRAAQLYFYSYSPCVCKCMQEYFSK